MVLALTLTSAAFAHGSSIPSKYTCDLPAGRQEANHISPPLSISGIPVGTKSLALLVDDPDIPQIFKQERGIEAFDHWVLFNIPPPTGATLEIGEASTVGVAGLNSAGGTRYTGPCPPPQYEPSEHRYFFRAYALDSMLDLSDKVTKADVLTDMQGHVLAQAELVGVYKRVT